VNTDITDRSAALKTLFGAALVWGVVRTIPVQSPLLAGWVGLFGLVFLLHFGLFHLLALMWQQAEVNAHPIMHAPILATSLAEFWGGRWNAAFQQLAHERAFQPLRRRFGPTPATLCYLTGIYAWVAIQGADL
jgi:Membrane bound O-acyl transferase family